MNQAPEPKPTRYAGINFRSRLEARWAVFLDFHFLVLDWLYEPRHLTLPNGWEYTPDFLFYLGDWKLFLEIKPEQPTEAYVGFVSEFLPQLSHPIYIAWGSFYKKEVPFVAKVTEEGLADCVPVTQFDPLALPLSADAIKAAKGYRFDLTERRPAFRRGSPSVFNKARRQSIQKERGQVPRNEPPPRVEPDKPHPKRKPKRKGGGNG